MSALGAAAHEDDISGLGVLSEVPTEPSPLAGYTVAVTADRRHAQLTTSLERRGARVLSAPALRIVPLADDHEALSATLACLEQPVEITVVTTGVGFRHWLDAADGWGVGESLRESLGSSRIIVRGPKARGAVRAAGLAEEWCPASESIYEVLERLLEEDLSGVRVAVQLHGEPIHDVVAALRASGAVVIPVPLYRWVLPDDTGPLRRMIETATARQLDAITFTSAPAVAGMLSFADGLGVGEALRGALAEDVIAFCVGPVTAGPLRACGIPTVQPDRSRLGSLLHCVAEQLPVRRRRTVHVGPHTLELRGHAVVLDGRLVELPPSPMGVLRALARQPGRVYRPEELLGGLKAPGAASPHAVEMAVTRLRALLGDAVVVQTVVKRGYRLAC